ncbi:hypothetical protein [Paenibacillus massiliensis]|uniref:hypothetical protein n=1 Tax=Paenibacillus massiliensis TaxID=225917 RepID=UPI000408F48F|nr:hypothetical protein [Paenibacillus massiliensis]
MSQYAYFTPFVGWEEKLPTGLLQTANEFEQVQLDALRLTDDERNVLRKSKKTLYLTCPICNGPMYYNKGFQIIKDGIREANKSPYFYHNNRENCHFSESLSHALTKKFIFSKLRDAGYTVYEETRHQIEGKKIRVDVAAYIGSGTTSKLRIVVEILASDMKPSAISKKINAYYSEGVPTAWVIVLDDLFTGYTGTKQIELDPDSEEINYLVHSLQPGEQNPFVVTGSNSKAFTLLMNEYGFVVAVTHAGEVFLIRRNPDNELQRFSALQRGEPWTTQDELYQITRIADKDVVRTLLVTPLRKLLDSEDVIYPKGAVSSAYPPKEGNHFEDQVFESSIEPGIDFTEGMVTGSEADKALDPVALIYQTWRAQQAAEVEYILEEKRLQAEEELRQHQADLHQQASKEHQHLENTTPRQMDIQKVTAPQQEDSINYINHNDSKRLASPKKIEEVERHLLLNGFNTAQKMDLFSISNRIADIILTQLSDDLKGLPIELIRNDETIWAAYETLSPQDRIKLERNVFPTGLPPWFMTQMIRLNQKETAEDRKRKAQLKRSLNKSTFVDEYPRFDF